MTAINTETSASAWDVEPISTIIQRIHFKYTTKGMRSISVLSEERGEGKTTVSMLLARGLTEVFNFRVLLVDLNPEGDVLLNQYLKKYHTKDGIVLDHPFAFQIFRVKDLDVDWSKSITDGLYLNRLIGSLSGQFDFVVVDTAHVLSQNEGFLKINTDTNLIVCTEKTFSNEHLKVKEKIKMNRKDLLGVVFNK
jgi:cellulose biosynthesis protein BcsQ